MPSRYDVKVTCAVCDASFPTVAESVDHEHFTDEYEQSHPEDICRKCGKCERNACESHRLCHC
jgi:hypothetical protein